MAQATVTSPAQISTPSGPGGKARFGRTGLLLLISAVAVVGVALSLAIHYWPFEEKQVLEDLQEVSDSQVGVQAFRRIYFPHPGCVLDGVVFVHGTNAAKPLIKIDRLTIQSTYLGILRHRVSLIDAERMVISIPPSAPGNRFTRNAPPLRSARSSLMARSWSLLRATRKDRLCALTFTNYRCAM